MPIFVEWIARPLCDGCGNDGNRADEFCGDEGEVFTPCLENMLQQGWEMIGDPTPRPDHVPLYCPRCVAAGHHLPAQQARDAGNRLDAFLCVCEHRHEDAS